MRAGVRRCGYEFDAGVGPSSSTRVCGWVQVQARGRECARAWVRTWACGHAAYTVDLFLYYVLL
jgi:hypothetical protein